MGIQALDRMTSKSGVSESILRHDPRKRRITNWLLFNRHFDWPKLKYVFIEHMTSFFLYCLWDSVSQEKIQSHLGVRDQKLVFRFFNFCEKSQIVLNHSAVLHMSECGIFTNLQKVCYNFLSMISNLFLFHKPNFKGKSGSFDIWDLLSMNQIGPGVSPGKRGFQNKKHNFKPHRNHV